MEPVTMAAAIATLVLTKALEKTGETLGEKGLEAVGKLMIQNFINTVNNNYGGNVGNVSIQNQNQTFNI